MNSFTSDSGTSVPETVMNRYLPDGPFSLILTKIGREFKLLRVLFRLIPFNKRLQQLVRTVGFWNDHLTDGLTIEQAQEVLHWTLLSLVLGGHYHLFQFIWNTEFVHNEDDVRTTLMRERRTLLMGHQFAHHRFLVTDRPIFYEIRTHLWDLYETIDQVDKPEEHRRPPSDRRVREINRKRLKELRFVGLCYSAERDDLDGYRRYSNEKIGHSITHWTYLARSIAHAPSFESLLKLLELVKVRTFSMQQMITGIVKEGFRLGRYQFVRQLFEKEVASIGDRLQVINLICSNQPRPFHLIRQFLQDFPIGGIEVSNNEAISKVKILRSFLRKEPKLKHDLLNCYLSRNYDAYRYGHLLHTILKEELCPLTSIDFAFMRIEGYDYLHRYIREHFFRRKETKS